MSPVQIFGAVVLLLAVVVGSMERVQIRTWLPNTKTEMDDVAD